MAIHNYQLRPRKETVTQPSFTNGGLKAAYAAVAEMRDSLERPVDEGIRDAVAILNAIGFPTTDSCEGHLPNEEEGHYYPYVEICAPEPVGWEEDESIEREWRLENLKLQQSLLQVLQEFEQTHNPDYLSRLMLRNWGYNGTFRLESTGAQIMALLDTEELAPTRDRYRHELNLFIEFLKSKYIPD